MNFSGVDGTGQPSVVVGAGRDTVGSAAAGGGGGGLDQLATICSYQELIQLKLSNTFVALSVILLLIINVMVIAGNILVILAVFVSSKLRTSTNYFIVSLAMADLLVGVAVLPYSLTHEILDSWVFGEVWCQGWLVIDVWLCTASILNLCAISVDRYLAVTRPVRYRSMMTSRRAKLVIAAVWALSFLICFPPLVGWNGNRAQVGPTPTAASSTGPTVAMPTMASPIPTSSSSEEQLLRTNRMIISTMSSYSSPTAAGGGSRTGLKHSSASPTARGPPGHSGARPIDPGITNNSVDMSDESDLTTSWLQSIGGNWGTMTSGSPSSTDGGGGGSATANSSTDEGGGSEGCSLQFEQCTLFNEKGYVIYSALGSFYIPMLFMFFFYWRIYLVASRTTRALKRGYRTTKSSKSSQGAGSTGSPEERMTLRIHRGYASTSADGCAADPSASPRPRSAGLFGTGKTPTIIESKCGDDGGALEMKQFSDQVAVSAGNTPLSTPRKGRRKLPITLYRSQRLSAHLDAAASGTADTGLNGDHHLDQNKLSPTPSINSNLYMGIGPATGASPSSPSSSREGSARMARFSRRANNSNTGKWQAKRFHAETKAAKTVGIIVGGFIICWFPFFTAYLIRAFCSDDCIPELLMSIFTWLGYCNSAINPVIYGLFSRDFRRAFKNIVCRCTCKEEVSVSSLIRQIHLPTFFEEEGEHHRHREGGSSRDRERADDDLLKSSDGYK